MIKQNEQGSYLITISTKRGKFSKFILYSGISNDSSKIKMKNLKYQYRYDENEDPENRKMIIRLVKFARKIRINYWKIGSKDTAKIREVFKAIRVRFSVNDFYDSRTYVPDIFKLKNYTKINLSLENSEYTKNLKMIYGFSYYVYVATKYIKEIHLFGHDAIRLYYSLIRYLSISSFGRKMKIRCSTKNIELVMRYKRLQKEQDKRYALRNTYNYFKQLDSIEYFIIDRESFVEDEFTKKDVFKYAFYFKNIKQLKILSTKNLFYNTWEYFPDDLEIFHVIIIDETQIKEKVIDIKEINENNLIKKFSKYKITIYENLYRLPLIFPEKNLFNDVRVIYNNDENKIYFGDNNYFSLPEKFTFSGEISVLKDLNKSKLFTDYCDEIALTLKYLSLEDVKIYEVLKMPPNLKKLYINLNFLTLLGNLNDITSYLPKFLKMLNTLISNVVSPKSYIENFGLHINNHGYLLDINENMEPDILGVLNGIKFHEISKIDNSSKNDRLKKVDIKISSITCGRKGYDITSKLKLRVDNIILAEMINFVSLYEVFEDITFQLKTNTYLMHPENIEMYNSKIEKNIFLEICKTYNPDAFEYIRILFRQFEKIEMLLKKCKKTYIDISYILDIIIKASLVIGGVTQFNEKPEEIFCKSEFSTIYLKKNVIG